MSTMTWNSLLLSKGSIFTFTTLKMTRDTEARRRTTVTMRKITPLRVSWVRGVMILR